MIAQHTTSQARVHHSRTSAARHLRARARTTRRGATLATVSGIYVFSLIAMIFNLKAGLSLLVFVNLMLLLIDWRAFVTLGDLVNWAKANFASRAALVVALLLGCVAPPIVLLRTLPRASGGVPADVDTAGARRPELN